MSPTHRRRSLIEIILVLLVVGALVGGYYLYSGYMQKHASAPTPAAYKTAAERSDIYVRFDMEAYDSIVTNYWKTPSDADMSGLFQQSAQKALTLIGINDASSTRVSSQDRAGTAAMLGNALSLATTTSAKRTLSTTILQVALYNLPPAGRDELLSQSDQVALQQEVSNINPTTNLYDKLGVATGSSVATVDTAYAQKSAALAASSSPEAKQELSEVTYAHKVLSATQDKSRYDTSQVEPTIFSSVFGRTLYIYISKMSPTTLQEFQEAIAGAPASSLDSMVIDLRGNIGGSLADAASLLGYFVGNNQYAFDLYAENTFNVIRTSADIVPALANYRDIAILTDDMTQSTAEVLTASLKRMHLAHVVGATTRGWGTVENTFPLLTSTDASTTYALLLVRAITLRDDQTPIQGRGVDPDVKISDSDWKAQLPNYFHSESLIAALRKEADQKPIQ